MTVGFGKLVVTILATGLDRCSGIGSHRCARGETLGPLTPRRQRKIAFDQLEHVLTKAHPLFPRALAQSLMDLARNVSYLQRRHFA